MDVIFYETFKEEERALRDALPASIQAQCVATTIQESEHDLPSARLISVRTQSVIPDEWSSKIDGVLTRSRGYDHLADFLTRTKCDVKCGHLPPYCSRAVAEQAVMFMLMLMRLSNRQQVQMKSFNREGLCGHEVFKKDALIVGVGCIGREIGTLLRGFGMHVKGVDPDAKHSDFKYTALPEGLRWADVIICAASLNNETRGMLDYAMLKDVKPKTILVNIARGEITPLTDLKRLLEEEILGGLALDVFEDEPRLAGELRAGDKASGVLKQFAPYNVIFTPHNAFNTEEALRHKAALSAQEVQIFLEKKMFSHQVMQTTN